MRADRLLQLLYLLRRHGRLPARRLAELLEVSERTVLRDMEALSAAGVPVYCEQGRGGGCVLMEGWETDVSGLSAEEAQALFAWSSRAAVTDLGLGPQLATALTKLAATVPQPALERADALAAVVVVDRRRWFAAAEEVPMLPELRDAAVRHRRVLLSYKGMGDEDPKERTVDPYGLVENAGRWYLLAARDSEVRSYRVSRIAAATLLDEPALIPVDLDLTAEWDRVRSRFESSEGATVFTVAVDPVALQRFRLIAGSQASSGTSAETIVGRSVSGNATTADWPVLRVSLRAHEAAVSLLLGFGGQIRLLDSPLLRQDMIDRAQAALAMHA